MTLTASAKRRAAVGATVVAVLATFITVVTVATHSDSAIAGTGDYSCGSSLIYGIKMDNPTSSNPTAKSLYSLDTTSGSVQAIGDFVINSNDPVSKTELDMNALAVTKDGSDAFAINDQFDTSTSLTSVGLYKYSISAKSSSWVGRINNVSLYGVKAGGIDPTTNTYWFAGPSSAADTTFNVYSYNLTTNTNNGLQFTTPTTGAAANSDLAFDAKGNLYMALSAGDGVASHNVLREYDRSTITAGGKSVAGTNLMNLSPTTSKFNSMAFGANGYLYTAANGSLYQTDPSNGSVIDSGSIQGGMYVSDLGSCATPNTLSVRTNVVSRVNTSDQFAVTIAATNGLSSALTGTTSGTDIGDQTAPDEVAGPALVYQSKSYSFSLSGSGTTALSNYTVKYVCLDTAGTQQSSGTTTSGTVLMPVAAGTGVNISCVFTVRMTSPHVRVTMTPTSTATKAGDAFGYSFSITNDGGESLKNVRGLVPALSAAGFDCGTGTLAMDETRTCTTGSTTYTVTQADVDAGSLTQAATISAVGANSAKSTSTNVSYTMTFAPTPALTVTLTNTGSPWVVGDSFTYVATVKNTGNVTMSSLGSTDTLSDTYTCAATLLAPGDSTTCTAPHTVTNAEVSGGYLTDTVTAAAKTPKNVSQTGSATLTLPIVKSTTLSVTKAVAGNSASAVAGATYTVRFSWSASGHSGSGSFTVKAGATAVASGIPVGSTVHLTEDTPPVYPDVKWAAPTFSANDFTAATSGNSVTLTNTAIASYELPPASSVTSSPADCPDCKYY